MDFAKLTDINYARILIRPRTTIRAIVDRDPRDRVIVLVVISGFVSALALAVQSRSPAAFMIGTRTIPVIAATTMRKIRIAQIVAAPVLAVVFLYINGALLRWAGGLLGGAAKSVEVRAALGWSSIPSMLSALFMLVAGLIDPVPAFVAGDPHRAIAMLASHWPHLAVIEALTVYVLVITLKCIGEVHGFSAWRALGALAIEIGVWAGCAIVLAITVPLVAVFLFR